MTLNSHYTIPSVSTFSEKESVKIVYPLDSKEDGIQRGLWVQIIRLIEERCH